MLLPLSLAVTHPLDFAIVWPFVVLIICLSVIIFLISVARVHSFFAVIIAALLAGGLAQTKFPGEYGTLPTTPHKEHSHWFQAAELTTEGFGKIAGKVGVVIALASVIGTCLVESGGADKVVRHFLGIFGEKRAGTALFSSSYILSIPIFFEAFFMLLLPLARSLRVRTGKDYMLFVLAICCGGTVTHSLIAPHPGPLAMVENLHLDLGHAIIVGALAGIIPASVGWLVARFLARRIDAPMRDTGGVSPADLEEMVARRDDQLPSLVASLTPILLPIILIGGASFLGNLGHRENYPSLFALIDFLGNRNIGLVVGAAFAVGLLMRQRGWNMAKVTETIAPPFATAGVIILIASAGGAFGHMLELAGVGESIKTLAEGRNVSLIFLAWSVSAVIRVAQGSATVAMITASSMLYPMIREPGAIPYHPMYIYLAIGFGSKMLSWMNDSGFWTVSKLAGFTEKETLESWTVVVSTISFTGLLLTLLVSTFLPFN